MEAFDVPDYFKTWIIDSWNNKQNDFLARYDFLITPQGDVKLIECNADTPTCLIETAFA